MGHTLDVVASAAGRVGVPFEEMAFPEGRQSDVCG
jgi:hypothetical protein